MRESEKNRVASEHRALFVFTAPAAVVVVVGLALVAGFASWNFGRVRDDSIRSNAATLAALKRNATADAADGKTADFNLCQAVRANAATLKAVIDTSYMTANPSIDLATLPPASQRLLVDLAPILGAYAEAAKANHDKVLAQVKDPPTCTPPTDSDTPVVSSVPTTRSGTTTTLAR